jgi:serine/threonine-protein kinase
MTITCAKCGAATHDETALFCGICGAPLAAAAPPAEAGGTPALLPDPDASPGSTLPAAPPSSALRAASDAPPPPDGPPADGAQPSGEKGPWKPPKHLPAGALIDKKYAVLRVLGEGGMGVVYLARDIHTGLDVVVKAVRSELAHRDDVRARTLAEGRALATIDHPNVVHLRAVAVEGPSLYLVMQYIEGESLDKVIARHAERGEGMPVDEALAVFRQVTAGVGAAHEEGVVHRDLKPANVLLRKKDRQAKVTDFGIALVQGDTSRPHTRGILGSLWYMSPEQVTGRRDIDHRVDVYALGILLYQMLVGRVPFDAKSDYDIMKLHAEAPMPLVSASRPDVPRAVDDLIQRACAKDRDQRFQRCEELLAAVDRLLGTGAPAPTLPGMSNPGFAVSSPGLDNGPLTAPPPTVPSPETQDEPVLPRRAVWPWALLGVVVLAGGAGAALAFGLVPGVPALVKLPRAPASASAAASAGASPRASASASASTPAPTGLDALVGAWVVNGRELDAVMASGDLEFRVRKPEQFAPQDYQAGEARFVLRPGSDPATFAVEDRIRPLPPVGKVYDPRARGTCQEVWTRVANKPLHARYDGARLTVELAKIEPGPANFTMEGGRVTSCLGLRALTASKVVSVLERQ